MSLRERRKEREGENEHAHGHPENRSLRRSHGLLSVPHRVVEEFRSRVFLSCSENLQNERKSDQLRRGEQDDGRRVSRLTLFGRSTLPSISPLSTNSITILSTSSSFIPNAVPILESLTDSKGWKYWIRARRRTDWVRLERWWARWGVRRWRA